MRPSRSAGSRRGSARRVALADPADAAAVREAALRLLERSRRTRFDLAKRLREQGYAAAVVDDVLDRLAAVGLVDDVEFACAFLAGRWGRRPAGWRRLETELRRRGVTAEEIAGARARIEEREGPADETETARRVLAQAERRYAALEPRVRRQRLWALLARRGFDGDVIARVLKTPPDGIE